MRHPAKARNVCMTLTLTCTATLAVLAMLPSGTISDTIESLVVMAALTTLFFGLMLSIKFALLAKAYRKLIEGQGVLAQWKVDPETWIAFIAYHDLLAPMNPKHRNLLKLNRNPSPDGVEVILGEKAIIVDGDFHDLPTATNDRRFEDLSLMPGPPAFINMHFTAIYFSKAGTTRTYFALRFPVPEHAMQDAQTVIATYTQMHNEMMARAQSLVKRFPHRVRNASLVVMILGAAAAATGFYFSNQPQSLDQDVALILAVAGTIITPVALILIIICHATIKKWAKA